MERKGILTVAAAIVAASVIIGLSQAWAQHSFRTEPRTADNAAGRYVVVNVGESELVIMDTTTGDLYSAKPSDVKPYATRPRAKTFAPAVALPPRTTTTTGYVDPARTPSTDRPPVLTTDRPRFLTTTAK